MHTFSCPKYKEPTLVEWREKYIDEGKVAQAETMGTLVDRGTEAMKVFKQICDQKVYMYATLDAILHLAMDVATLLSKNDNGESGFPYRNEKDKDLDYDKDETKNGCPADNCMLVELGPQCSTKLSHVALFKHTFSQELHFSSWPSQLVLSFLPSFLSSFQSFSSELHLNQVVAGGSGWHLSAVPHLLSLERGIYITLRPTRRFSTHDTIFHRCPSVPFECDRSLYCQHLKRDSQPAAT